MVRINFVVVLQGSKLDLHAADNFIVHPGM